MLQFGWKFFGKKKKVVHFRANVEPFSLQETFLPSWNFRRGRRPAVFPPSAVSSFIGGSSGELAGRHADAVSGPSAMIPPWVTTSARDTRARAAAGTNADRAPAATAPHAAAAPKTLAFTGLWTHGRVGTQRFRSNRHIRTYGFVG